VDEVTAPHIRYMELVREHWEVIAFVKGAIKLELFGVPEDERAAHVVDAAAEWYTLPREAMEALWKAPSNGGVFTTAERAYIKDNFRKLAHGAAA
jgi:hypothetical protein